MSLLLEALQKSARQRQLGTPVSLDESLRLSPPAPRRAPRWNGMLLIAAAGIAVFFAVRGWFGVQSEPVAVKQKETAAAEAPTAGRRLADQTTDHVADQAPPGPAIARSGAARPDAISNEAASGGRSRDVSPPYDKYQRPPPSRGAVPAAKPAAPGKEVDPVNLDYRTAERLNQPPGVVDQNAEPADEPVWPLPKMPPLPGAELISAEPFTEKISAEKTSAEATGAEAASAPETALDETPVGGPLGYDDLPPAVRRELPPLKITISVYDDDPKKRFILVDRQRYLIGDELAPGLKLRDIKRDGLLLEFKEYLFVWQRR